MRKRKERNGLKSMVFGAVLLGSGLTAVGSSIGIIVYKIKQPEYHQTIRRIAKIDKELNMPVQNSNLYLNQDYEEEKARISRLEEESVFLKNHEEKYFSPYTSITNTLAWFGFGIIPGMIMLNYGHSKYKLSQKEREEKETAENQ